jgi:hypothetical protein
LPWIPATVAASIFSHVLCVSGWPAARIGVFVNVAILVFPFAANRLRWFV